MMLPIVSSLFDVVWVFFPLMVAYCVWGIYVYQILGESSLAVEVKNTDS
jgi:hypothetical protein